MRIKLKFFSTLRDAVGINEMSYETSMLTVGALWQELELKFPKLSIFTQSRASAINHEYVQASQKLGEGDEVAFFPPVSGG